MASEGLKARYDEQTGTFTSTSDGGVPAAVKRFAPPLLSAGPVGLRPFMPSDYEFVHLAETTGETGLRWRFYGRTPSADEWLKQTFGEHILAQFLRCGVGGGATVTWRHSADGGSGAGRQPERQDRVSTPPRNWWARRTSADRARDIGP